MANRFVVAAAAALALAAFPATAQVDATEVEAGDMFKPAEDMGDFRVTAEAGLGTYMGGLREFTGTGPVWGVLLAGPIAQSFGWELGYHGARTPFDDDRVSDGSAAWRNGVDAMAKVYPPVEHDFRPFAAVGFGASYTSVSAGADEVYQNDWTTEVPLGLGLEYTPGENLSAGIRGTYRALFGQQLGDTAGEGFTGGLISASLTLGGRF